MKLRKSIHLAPLYKYPLHVPVFHMILSQVIMAFLYSKVMIQAAPVLRQIVMK